MSLKEGSRMAKIYFGRERAIRGRGQYEHPGDRALVKSFLKPRDMRVFSSVIGKAPERLPQTERVGVVFFLALITITDDIVDEGAQFQERLSRDEFKTRLLQHPIPGLDLSIGELTDLTLARFPQEEKRTLIETYLDDMITLHADTDKTYPGDYTYAEAVDYRDKTNNPLLELTNRLIGIDDPEELNRFNSLGLLFQHADDAEDWLKDSEKGASNLWVGMATDIAQEHPEELQALREYVALPKEERPKGSLKKWMRTHMPYTHGAYLEKYDELLSQTHGAMRAAYWMWRRTVL